MGIQHFRGFILQSTYRMERGSPVILIYGRLIDGRSFLVRETRQIPQFFIRSVDAPAAARFGITASSTDWNTLDGYAASRITATAPNHIPAMRERLQRNAIVTYEADVRFAVNYLIDHDIRGTCRIEGQAHSNSDGVDLVFTNPRLIPDDFEFAPTALSFDIETDPDAQQLLAIAIYGESVDHVYVLDSTNRPTPANATACLSQRELIDRFVAEVQRVDPDVLTGWNVVDFDLNVLNRIATRESTALTLGRDQRTPMLRGAQGYFGSGQATIAGRLVLDGMDLVRGAFMRFDEYSLDRVATEVLGTGKTIHDAGGNRAEEILRRYEEDLEAFVTYARTDARLALQIVEKLKLLSLAVARSQLTGMTPDRVAASIASFDFVYMSALRKRKLRAPTVRSDDSRVFERHSGGHVLEPEVGIHENVWVFDYKSLYPSVIRTFNIDPAAFLPNDGGSDAIELLNGARFNRDTGILPSILDTLFVEREAAQRRHDPVASQAIKILMNSFYGVLATPACRFHDATIGNAITTMGRHFLRWSKSWFEDRGYRVLYGDTDSVFVLSGFTETDRARSRANTLTDAFNESLGEYINATWRVESRLVLEFEKLYQRLFLLPLKRGKGGARKRYAGVRDDQNRLEFVGLEAVRRDWTDLAKKVQRDLYQRLFAGEEVEDYLYQIAKSLRNGEFDDMLVYHKGLNKPLGRYKNNAPHVVAARKALNVDRVVHYMITTDGPEPVDNLRHAPDHEHYLNTQIRSVAQPVLEMLGLDFDFVVHNTNQIPLF